MSMRLGAEVATTRAYGPTKMSQRDRNCFHRVTRSQPRRLHGNSFFSPPRKDLMYADDLALRPTSAETWAMRPCGSLQDRTRSRPGPP
jgi:hypothetical protein